MKSACWLQAVLLSLLLMPGLGILAGCKGGGGSEGTAVTASPAPASATKERAETSPGEEEEDESTDFEIDGEATRYFGVAPMTVKFSLTTKNAKEPVKYDWDFGDGSPHAKGKDQIHTYKKPGTFRAFVVATDASGALDNITFIFGVVSKEAWDKRHKQSEKAPKKK